MRRDSSCCLLPHSLLRSLRTCPARAGADVVIGTAGRLAPEKNMALLVHAYALMRLRVLQEPNPIRSRLLLVRLLIP